MVKSWFLVLLIITLFISDSLSKGIPPFSSSPLWKSWQLNPACSCSVLRIWKDCNYGVFRYCEISIWIWGKPSINLSFSLPWCIIHYMTGYFTQFIWMDIVSECFIGKKRNGGYDYGLHGSWTQHRSQSYPAQHPTLTFKSLTSNITLLCFAFCKW